MIDPVEMLVPPSDDEPIPALADLLLSGMGTILSPSAIVRSIMNQVFDWDPVDEVLKNFTGDWNGVAQASRAYGALANYVAQVGVEAGAMTPKAQQEWFGGSADSFSQYVTGDLGPALAELSTQIVAVATQYHDVAFGMYESAKVCDDIINFIIDLIILEAAATAAAAGTSWTGVGAVVGVIAMAATFAKLMTTVSKLSKALSAIQVLLDVSLAGTQDHLDAIRVFKRVPIPSL